MSIMPKILIVDDDEGMRAQLKWGLDGFDVITADSRPHAIELFDLYHPPLVTLDLGLPPDAEGTTEGFATLKEILRKSPQTRIVIISGSEDLGSAEMARCSGAFEYYPKPVELDRLQQVIQSAYADYQASLNK